MGEFCMKKFNIPTAEAEKTIIKTIRIKLSTEEQIEKLSKTSGLSVNRIFNECIQFALDNLDNSNLKK